MKSFIFAEKLATMEYKYNRKETPKANSVVAQYQKRLNYIRDVFHGNWQRLTTRGIYGRMTRDAVKGFQTYANISPTGNLDHSTQAHIVQYYEKAKRGYTPAPSRPIANYQLANANYTAAPQVDVVATSGPRPLSHRPAVDTSSIIDSEWKSLGKDMMSIVEEVAKGMKSKDFDRLPILRKYIRQSLDEHSQELNNLRRRMNTVRAKQRDAKAALWSAGIIDERNKRKYDLNTNWAEEPRQRLKELERVEKDLQKQTTELAEQASKKASKALSRGAAVVNWGVNVGTAGYYIYNMVEAESEEEYQEYSKKLTDTMATTAIDVGLTLGANAIARVGAGAAGGPAGIVVATLFTVVDVVCLATTGESLSTKIWEFIKGIDIDWDRINTNYNYAYMDMNGRRSFGPKY